MKTVTLRAEIAPNGVLHLDIPSDLPPGPAEVVVVIQPCGTTLPTAAGPPYRSDRGVWAGLLPDLDVDAVLQEMQQDWEKSMELPE